MKVRAWILEGKLNCCSQLCFTWEECPSRKYCKEYEIELKESIPEENPKYKFIKIDNKDYGCCASECVYLNEAFNHCALFSEKLFGINGFTRCAKCHSVKEKP